MIRPAGSLKTAIIPPWPTDPAATIDPASGVPKRCVFRACYADPLRVRVLAAFARRDDREALREALAEVREYKGVTGTFHFEAGSGGPPKSADILQIEDGAFQWASKALP